MGYGGLGRAEDLPSGRSWHGATRSSWASPGETARWHHRGWDTARVPGIPWAWAVPDILLLAAWTMPGSVVTPSSMPSQWCHRPVPSLSQRSRWSGFQQCGRVGVCAAVPTLPRGARCGGGPGGRRDVSRAKQGGGRQWLLAAPPVPEIRRWLRTPRDHHSLLARLWDMGKQRGKFPPLSRQKERQMGNLPGCGPQRGGN